ncbi:MoaD/ThiS family protein [Kitasatospora sp. NBC_01287]|uniref:MoaD/ThiS family protein n=1 Tax=Kitasatospora sp. NBC_01287 TaxID=2903573 RepID=UPI002255A84A|nr:MoaD/ThiS family protein [Kitasatospora sp. NBC_01287]MCX4747396.1 MoaD/ThiS family protein [Kitasatospora sp. NBC_01287]
MTATTEPSSGPGPGGTPAAVVTGTIRYWAAAKAEAGTAEERYRAANLAEALAQAAERHADRPKLVRLLGICSYLVDSKPVGGRDRAQVALSEGGTIEVLPPFAGG